MNTTEHKLFRDYMKRTNARMATLTTLAEMTDAEKAKARGLKAQAKLETVSAEFQASEAALLDLMAAGPTKAAKPAAGAAPATPAESPAVEMRQVQPKAAPAPTATAKPKSTKAAAPAPVATRKTPGRRASKAG